MLEAYPRSAHEAGYAPALGCEADAPSLALPCHPAVVALVLAVMSGGSHAEQAGWRAWECGVSITERVAFDSYRVSLWAPPDEAWSDVTALSPLTLDVLVWMLAHAPLDGESLQLVQPSAILQAKTSRRFGRERQGLEEQIRTEVLRLGKLRIGAFDEPVFQLAPVGDHSMFVYRLHSNLCRLAAGSAPAALPQRVLALDHRFNRGADVLAKKLAVYFTLTMTGAASTRTMRSVLRAVGALPEVSADGARGGRFADRFLEAVLRLGELGLFELGGEACVQGGGERAKGWTRRWLETDVDVRRLAPRDYCGLGIPFASSQSS